MADLDRLLRSDIADAAAEAAEPPDFARVERRGEQRRRTRNVLVVAVTAVLVVLVGFVGFGRARILGDKHDTLVTPVHRSTSSPTSTREWTGPLRPDASMPVLRMDTDAMGEFVRRDGRDAALGAVDIRQVHFAGFRNFRWGLDLRRVPPRASTLDPARRIIEYGLVIDADGDRVADCQVGINNDAPKRGEFRVWVKNLTSGVIAQQLGPPYGYPIDFVHPDEARGDDLRSARTLNLFFLGAQPAPCGRFSDSASFYAWASVTAAGRVTSWDYAPDAGWLHMPS